MRAGRQVALLGLALLLAGPPAALAQTVAPLAGGPSAAPLVVDAPEPKGEGVLPVMTLDQEALYAGTKWGQRVKAELERRGQEIAAENERLANQFSAEEQSLTLLRQTMPADEFRKQAEEFDKRAVEVRRQREAAAEELNKRAADEYYAFSRAMLPVLAALMRERGAVAVLDKRAILVAAQSIDVTEALIQRIDSEIGAGPLQQGPNLPAPQEPAEPSEAAPEPSAPAE
ncbi:OmpH family outer membrane protein [Paracoccus sp. N5]|uniref:OmpH family outer membrane protein n=1 Tax=Paracoccus sp. N5 TaxID=1101189 RepID=UPI00036B911F|nr:OmpH family outer membrane protein [Paracoccus sp. N5]